MLQSFGYESSESEPVAEYGVSNLDCYRVLERRPLIHKGDKLSVFSALINIWGQISKQSLIEFPADKLWFELFAIYARELCAPASAFPFGSASISIAEMNNDTPANTSPPRKLPVRLLMAPIA